MKEHVIIMRTTLYGWREEEEINKWLDAGWTVKHIHSFRDNSEITLIVVLQHGV